MNESLVAVPVERIERAIFVIRGERVMPDRDLAFFTVSQQKSSTRQSTGIRTRFRQTLCFN